MKIRLAAAVLPCVLAMWASALRAEPVKVADGVEFSLGTRVLKIEVVGESIIRVAYAPDAAFFKRASLIRVANTGAAVPFELTSDASAATISTTKLKVRVDLKTGAVSFMDSAGKPILAEKANGRVMTTAVVQGDDTFHVRQQWEPVADESLYGLGQHHFGAMNIKGLDLDLWQHNGTVIVPMLVSSKGYGILWDNASYSRFGDLRQIEPLPRDKTFDADGKPGGLTVSYFGDARFEKLAGTRVEPQVDIRPPVQDASQQGPWQGSGQWVGAGRATNTRLHPDLPARGDVSVRWEGFVEPAKSGLHTFQAYSNAGIKVWIDDKLVMNHWRQGWLPWYDMAQVDLTQGKRAKIKVEWVKDQGGDQIRLGWKTPTTETGTALWSEVGEGIDYYFIYGPKVDDVVAGYRQVTGPAVMMPKWVFGLWQSRQRYETAKQLLDVVEGFRKRAIPLDNIVMDWFYWRRDQWGSHEFDPERFPDPIGWIKSIHDLNARFMISVWPKFYPGNKNFDAMRAKGYLFERPLADELKDWVGFQHTFYDAFNPAAGKLFWSQIERELLSKNVDAWWLDATEPDLTRNPTLQGQRINAHPTFLGIGARVLNAYALQNSKAVYEGQRAKLPDQRVFILTRSGFAGQQRYATASWSGDITSTWTAMQKQISAGMSFSISGVPYWTMDSGGFAVPAKYNRRGGASTDDVDDWRELNTRWFEFATFVPLLRVHGEAPFREMWEFGGEDSPAYKAQLKFDRLRYRLLPYVYSLAGNVTQRGGTLMRGLVFDFPDDAKARDIADQFLLGQSLLVSPVTTPKATHRDVYLPAGTPWYDFWTGQPLEGGQTVTADAPYDAIPVHVRAGAILPVGPELQYTAEKKPDPLTLFVYGGADGAFTLYEDDGLTYGYEKGAFSQIPLTWNDKTATLTLGKRQGNFPGMLEGRTFEVVFVEKGKPVGFSFEPKPDQVVKYTGDAIEVHIRR